MNIAELLLSNLIGLVVGLATSFFSWWVLFHKIVPMVTFAEELSKIPRTLGPGHSYRFKFQNTGQRGIIGAEVRARLTLNWGESQTISGTYLALDGDGSTTVDIPRIAPNGYRIFTLWINRTKSLSTNARFKDAIGDRQEAQQLTLEELLSIGNNAKIQVYISGYDEFSGARKVFISDFYQKNSIRNGEFVGLAVSMKPISKNLGDS